MTRALLKASEYTQVKAAIFLHPDYMLINHKVPQLCVGRELDLNQPLIL